MHIFTNCYKITLFGYHLWVLMLVSVHSFSWWWSFVSLGVPQYPEELNFLYMTLSWNWAVVLNCFLKWIISWLLRDRNSCLALTGKLHPEQWPLIDIYHTYKYKFLLFSASVHRRTKLQLTMEENSLKSFSSFPV